jgi:glycosyltransferase involved in cell wall biosynthesis
MGLRHYYLKAQTILHNRFLARRLGRFSTERDPKIAGFYARTIMDRLKQNHYDAIVAPGTIPVALVETDVPLITWTDATFHCLVTTYHGYMNMTSRYYREGEWLERQAFERARLCVFSSDWAAQSAIRDYGVEEWKVKVLPLGGNVDDDDAGDDVDAAIAARDMRQLKLLFAGTSFEAKGGPKVFEVLAELRRLQIPAELDIVGCGPVVPESLRPYVRVHGFVPKSTEEGRRKLAGIFQSSHWLILLSLYECYGLVFAEANRYGLPCISHRVGGISTPVKDEWNGKLFPLDSSASEIAAYLARLSRDRERYQQMAQAAYHEYQTRLNWRVASRTLLSLIGDMSSSHGPRAIGGGAVRSL